MKFLIVPGSQRRGSLNLQLAHVVAAQVNKGGDEAELFDLRALQLPIYDGDIEARDGVPAAVNRLREAIENAEAVVFVTPEYNAFPPPLLLNSIDWLSRIKGPDRTRDGIGTTTDKPTGIISASPTPLGGVRSLLQLRTFLQLNLSMLVVPQQCALSNAADAFDESGALKDARSMARVDGVLSALRRVARGRAAAS